jgi:hypothetical protein
MSKKQAASRDAMADTPATPKADRPDMPKGYGVPKHNKGLLPWSHVVERMTQAKHFWICSVRPDGRPHSVPLWAVWVDNMLYYDGAPETIHNRNVAANPNVSVHLEDCTAAVIFEGKVRLLHKPDRDLAEGVAAAYRVKYAAMGYSPKASDWDNGGLYEITPSRVLAWTQFAKDCTRWRFEA